MIIKKQYGIKGLILGGRGDIQFHRQMGKKSLNFSLPHVLRVAFVMKENISFDPGNVGLFSSDGMAFKANTLSDKI